MLQAHATFMQPLQCVYCLAAPCAHSCSHYNAICIHALQITMEEPIMRRNKRICNRPTYPSSPAAATLHRKTKAVLEVLAPSLVWCSGSPACCHGCLAGCWGTLCSVCLPIDKFKHNLMVNKYIASFIFNACDRSAAVLHDNFLAAAAATRPFWSRPGKFDIWKAGGISSSAMSCLANSAPCNGLLHLPGQIPTACSVGLSGLSFD